MKVGTDNSIYSLFTPTPRARGPSIADEKINFSATPPPEAPPIRSDQELVSDFYARMTKQQLEWADTDQDGKVTKSEYMDGQTRLAELNGKPNDPQSSEDEWAKLDSEGKGWLNETELRSGLEKLLPVKVGHLDPKQAERLRYPQPQT